MINNVINQQNKSIVINKETKQHTIGMFIVGAGVWILYLGYANLLTLVFGVNHFISEGTGIPLSWIINYWINTKFNFDLKFSWKRFGSFCGISAIGWCIYLLTTWTMTDNLKLWSLFGTVTGVATKTVFNVALQQIITFNWLAKDEKKETMNKSQRADYDWNAYYYGNMLQKWWKRQLSRKISQFVTPVGSVLDVGCGSSPTLSMLQNREKYGIDLNADKIKFMAHKDESSAYWLLFDSNKLPFDDNKFDNVMCNEVIEHHPNPHLLLQELSRVTKECGYVVIATPDFGTIKWNIIEMLYSVFMKTGYELEHGSKFTQSILVDMADIYGLSLIDIDYVGGCDMVCQFIKRKKD